MVQPLYHESTVDQGEQTTYDLLRGKDLKNAISALQLNVGRAICGETED